MKFKKDTPLLWIGWMLLLTYTSLAFADNEITIEQLGNNVTLTIEQAGYNNVIEGINGVGIISGASNTIGIYQGVRGKNYIAMAVDGNSNSIIVAQEKWANETGGFDDDTAGGSVGEHYAEVDVAGSNNSVTMIQRNNDSSVTGQTGIVRIQGGDNNTVDLLQGGAAGNNGHSALVTIRPGRDGNTVNVMQSSTSADHNLILSVYSDDNNIDVNQSGASANQAYVLFSADSVGPTDFTLNQTGGATYGSTSYVTQYCANAGGCSVTITQGQ